MDQPVIFGRSTMLKIAICDDNGTELKRIEDLVLNYTREHPEQNLSIACFRSPQELQEQMGRKRFQIYLLDIIMDGTDGIALGKAIRRQDKKAAIIYLTSSPDYAVASYTVNAYYYLLKPISADNLYPVLARAAEAFENEASDYLTVRTRDGSRSLVRHFIMYIEYHCHILSYHLNSGKVIDSVTTRVSFDQEAEAVLKDPRFTKISSSYIVNLTYVETINKKGFYMKDGAELAVTRSYSNARRQYLEYLLEGVKHHDI